MQEANVGDNTVLTQNYHLWSAWAGQQQLDVSGQTPIMICSSNIIASDHCDITKKCFDT